MRALRTKPIMSSAPRLADCHLHFEGTVPLSTVRELARRAGHRFAQEAALREARQNVRNAADFLALFAEVCRLFRGPEDYAEASRAVVRALAADGVAYAEIYVSPEIFGRLGLERRDCLEAIDEGFREEGRLAGITCRILLDAVRHWGTESAHRVLGLYESTPLSSIVGFGLGGDETALPAAAFAEVYERARALGLKTAVHAGEWAGPESLREALVLLKPDRIDHGIAAVKDPDLLERLADDQTVLCVAPTGNLATGAVASLAEHPLPRLFEAGVRVALAADDPLLFGTTTSGEYAVARERFGFDDASLTQLAEHAWQGAFCTPEERLAGLARLGVATT
ncbi:MAG: adenosine deaminase [Thermoanaerobaculia bacterium]